MDRFNGPEGLDEAVARASSREASAGAKVSAKGCNTMANALKFHTVVRGKTLPLPDLASDDLSSFEGKRVEVIVVEEETAAALPPQQPRRFGTLAGQFVVPDDFDAPLRWTM
jgi:hypothetical protein